MPTSFFPRGSNPVRNNDSWTARATCFIKIVFERNTSDFRKEKIEKHIFMAHEQAVTHYQNPLFCMTNQRFKDILAKKI